VTDKQRNCDTKSDIFDQCPTISRNRYTVWTLIL